MKRRDRAIERMKGEQIALMRSVLVAIFRASRGTKPARLARAVAAVNRNFSQVDQVWQHEVEWWGVCHLLGD